MYDYVNCNIEQLENLLSHQIAENVDLGMFIEFIQYTKDPNELFKLRNHPHKKVREAVGKKLTGEHKIAFELLQGEL
jgi:hypothetical protein